MIFISYSAEDREWAVAVKRALEQRGRDAFIDRDLSVGSAWAEQLMSRLTESTCMLVLWSKASTESFWVRSEAAEGLGRGMLLQASIDGTLPPGLFRSEQCAMLTSADPDADPEFGGLLSDVEERLGGPAFRGLNTPSATEPVSAESLVVIHTAWRVPERDEEFRGRKMYRIHAMLFGHRRVLDRVDSVSWRLAGYPDDRLVQVTSERETNFALKELAWGWSLLRADVHLSQQPVGHPNPVRLYRFLNMSDSGTRLAPYLGGIGGRGTSSSS